MSKPITIHCPPVIDEALQLHADASGHTIQAEILKRLAESLDMEYVPPKRGRRWPKKL